MGKCLESYVPEALTVNKNFETGCIFPAESPYPVEDEGGLWAPPLQLELK